MVRLGAASRASVVYDPDTGKDLVIQDGHWIVVFGAPGSSSSSVYFMLCCSRWAAARKMKTIPSKADRTLVSRARVHGLRVVRLNMLPNMLLPNLQFFFAGGLAVLLKELPKQAALDQRPLLSQRPPAPPGARCRISQRLPPIDSRCRPAARLTSSAAWRAPFRV